MSKPRKTARVVLNRNARLSTARGSFDGWRHRISLFLFVQNEPMPELEKKATIEATSGATFAGTACPPSTERRYLPDTRCSLTHKFNISGHEGYIIVGLFENG